MAEGDVSTDGYSSTRQGYFFPQRSIGSRTIVRELIALHNLWVPLTQMLQVAPGNKWCKVCGDVRPDTYFDVTEWDERGKVTAWENGKPTEWDGVPFPTKWHDACKECANSHDPKLRRMKYCSACKVDHPRADFGDDDDYADGKYPSCYASERRRKNADNARRKWVEEGRELRAWNRQTTG